MDKTKISKKLVKMRKEAGLTQCELSEATGISQSHISFLESTGEINRMDDLRNLAAAYNMEPSELIKILYDSGKK
jgi:transcriptional regulator with XRE-family HTH domain